MTANGADGVQPFPFDLPPAFLAQLGYERAAGPSALPESTREMLRRTNISEAEIAATEQAMLSRQPRRWVALYWQPAGDELAWDDGHGSGAGQLNHWLYLAFLHEPGPGRDNIYAWLTEHAVDLGSSEESATPLARGRPHREPGLCRPGGHRALSSGRGRVGIWRQNPGSPLLHGGGGAFPPGRRDVS